jgi:hypothetical protein
MKDKFLGCDVFRLPIIANFYIQRPIKKVAYYIQSNYTQMLSAPPVTSFVIEAANPEHWILQSCGGGFRPRIYLRSPQTPSLFLHHSAGNQNISTSMGVVLRHLRARLASALRVLLSKT